MATISVYIEDHEIDVDPEEIFDGLSYGDKKDLLKRIIEDISPKDIAKVFSYANVEMDMPEIFDIGSKDQVRIVAKELTDNIADEERIYNLIKDNL